MLSIKKRNWKRIVKFLAVGLVSFVIDFSILNVLSTISNINKGAVAAFFSAISFLFANFNSYYFNKKWTFKENNLSAKYKTFLKISIIGVIINAIIIYFMTDFINQNLFSGTVWLNISKLIASLLVASFNYINYKKFVFKVNK